MNRSRRPPQKRNFVSGGIYNPQQSYIDQQGNQGTQYQRRQNQNYDNKNIRNENTHQEQQENKAQEQQRYENTQPPPLEPPPQPPQMEEDPPEEEDVKVEDSGLYDESGKLQYKNIFRTRKKSSVRAKEKKIRQNRQLRKTLIPKNALMVLNEVVGLTISEFTITTASGGGFVAVVTVNDKQYEGKGHSKIAAKNSASEKALRDYVLEKMREKPRLRKSSVNNDESMEMAVDAPNETVSENGEDGQQDNSGTSAQIDDVPMVNLASFAIFKLFTEWENEGYVVPELRVAHPPQTGSGNDSTNGDGNPQFKPPKAAPIRSELPNNWESIHPSTLLCMMRPGLQYREIGTVGDPPNVLQRMGVTVDEVDYESSGRSKKTARRNVAVCVLNELFGTNFVKEPPFEE
ncbi:uncharacterized protein LOC105228862 isoform X1 [Bactrocera dorsalis]|uniref:Uncharacterized protein LOC105228862 isoform X1 n=2 Tax=Bactrocera dorsalis TaxID=27457 RepID=A0A6J0RNC5_BACDO|nr:uncharacterized protein LOC105228862 isoform X1 [Bactrocera dorsalis]